MISEDHKKQLIGLKSKDGTTLFGISDDGNMGFWGDPKGTWCLGAVPTTEMINSNGEIDFDLPHRGIHGEGI